MTKSQPWLAAGGAVGPLDDDEACLLLMWCWSLHRVPMLTQPEGLEAVSGVPLLSVSLL